MKIEIPDKMLKSNFLSEKKFILELALFLYQKNFCTLESASKFAGLESYQFQKELGKRKIPVHYTVNDFQDDLRTLREP